MQNRKFTQQKYSILHHNLRARFREKAQEANKEPITSRSSSRCTLINTHCLQPCSEILQLKSRINRIHLQYVLPWYKSVLYKVTKFTPGYGNITLQQPQGHSRTAYQKRSSQAVRFSCGRGIKTKAEGLLWSQQIPRCNSCQLVPTRNCC